MSCFDKNIVLVSSPDKVKDESSIINSLFDKGLCKLHLRKPLSTEEEVRRLISKIESKYWSKLALHQFHHIAPEFGISHLHFKEIDRTGITENLIHSLRESNCTISTSVHQLSLLDKLSCFDYIFYGPVFNSISKSGYLSNLDDDFKLDETIKSKVFAIGGINEGNILKAKKMGFSGAALLGVIWQQPALAVQNYVNIIEKCRQSVPMY